MNKQQEAWLAAFADRQMEIEAKEALVAAQNIANYERELAREAFIQAKKQEFEQAVANFDSK